MATPRTSGAAPPVVSGPMGVAVVVVVVVGVLLGLLLSGLVAFVWSATETKAQHRAADACDARGVAYALSTSTWRAARADAPYLLVVHSLYMDRQLFAQMIEQWPTRRRFNVVLPDVLGHGQSPWPDGRCPSAYSIRQFAETLYDVLRRHVPPRARVHVMGTCAGGTLALEVAKAVVERCDYDLRSIMLLAFPYFQSAEQARTMGVRYNAHMYSPLGFLHLNVLYYAVFRQRWLLRDAIRRMMRTKYGPGFTEPTYDGAMNCSMEATRAMVTDIIPTHRSNAAVEAVRRANVPSLVVCGRNDALCREQQDVLARDLGPRSRLRWIDNAGHFFLCKHLRETMALLDAFVRDIGVAEDTDNDDDDADDDDDDRDSRARAACK